MEEVKKLKKTLELLEEFNTRLSGEREKFQEQHKDLFKAIENLSEEQAKLKEEIKIISLGEFKQTGSKKLFGGIGIREGISLNYEEEEALEWAKKHQLCLSLDKKSFERMAKGQGLNFVKQEEKITVTFPKTIKYDEVEENDKDRSD